MEYIKKIKEWIAGKPTWVKVVVSMIVSLVAIILTFTNCSASYMMHKKGVHADSVEVWVKTKTNNATY